MITAKSEKWTHDISGFSRLTGVENGIFQFSDGGKIALPEWLSAFEHPDDGGVWKVMEQEPYHPTQVEKVTDDDAFPEIKLDDPYIDTPPIRKRGFLVHLGCLQRRLTDGVYWIQQNKAIRAADRRLRALGFSDAEIGRLGRTSVMGLFRCRQFMVASPNFLVKMDLGARGFADELIDRILASGDELRSALRLFERGMTEQTWKIV